MTGPLVQAPQAGGGNATDDADAPGLEIERLKASESRYRLLIELQEATTALTDPDDIMRESARHLGEHLGVDRCAYAEVEGDQDHFVITGNFGTRLPSIVGRWRMADFGAECLRQMRAGEPYVVNDSWADPRTAEYLEAYHATQIRAVICLPLIKAGRFVACMAVHQAQPRRWTEREIELTRIVVARCWDALQRARAMREVVESEARFRETADTSPVLMWTAGPDGHFTWFNKPWLQFIGQAADAPVGEEWIARLQADDASAWQNCYGTALAAREPLSLEVRVMRADGCWRWLLINALPRFRAASGFAGYVGSCVDITERKEAEERLSQQAAEQAALFTYTDRLQRAADIEAVYEASLDAIQSALRCDRCAILLTTNGRMEFVASRRLSAAYQAVAAGHSPWPADCDDARPIVMPDVAQETGFSPDLRDAIHVSGIRSVAFFPLTFGDALGGKFMVYFDRVHRYADSELELGMTIARQFSFAVERLRYEKAQRTAEAALREMNQRKDQFLATLAHELRNPLSPIYAAVGILKHPDTSAAVSAQTLVMLERQTRHLVRLVDDLLDLSRIEQDKIELRIKPVDIQGVVRSAIEICEPMIRGREHQLHIAMLDEPILVNADPVRLSQVFSNLLSNAAKYTANHGRLDIAAHRLDAPPAVVVSVRDNGIGIRPDLQAAIFEMFVTGTDKSREQGGLGIGLTLARRLVQMHGGSIVVQSAGEGQGSEFIVTLPVVAQQPAALDLRGASSVAARRSSARRILVADDNEDAALSLSILLQMAGHDVTVVHDGMQALQAAAEFAPDVAILDLGMPRMDGFQAARALRQRVPGLVLIALTGWGDTQRVQQALEAGFDHHLVKPLMMPALERVLARQGA